MLSRVETSNRSEASSTAFGVCQRELDEQTSVISVEGDLDLSTAPRLKWMLIDALETGHGKLVVDLTLATFMDSTALGVLVGVNRRLDVSSRLAIACARHEVLKIFEFSGMDEAFAIFPTVDEALEYTRGQATRVS